MILRKSLTWTRRSSHDNIFWMVCDSGAEISSVAAIATTWGNDVANEKTVEVDAR